jgi:predicted nucleic acid-binding protein
MYLLDTNVVSELRRGSKASLSVQRWADRAPKAEFHLSVISVLEVEKGILLLERRDPQQAGRLRDWFENQLLPQFKNRILSIDTSIARKCAQLHVPNPKSEADALIAATALVHGLTVVTRNTADFAQTGVNLVDPWTTSDAAT